MTVGVAALPGRRAGGLRRRQVFQLSKAAALLAGEDGRV
jgi:hypothetical protein